MASLWPSNTLLQEVVCISGPCCPALDTMRHRAGYGWLSCTRQPHLFLKPGRGGKKTLSTQQSPFRVQHRPPTAYSARLTHVRALGIHSTARYTWALASQGQGQSLRALSGLLCRMLSTSVSPQPSSTPWADCSLCSCVF